MGLVDDLNAVKDQLGKVKAEIVGKLGELQNALADATSTKDEAVAAAVASLKEAAQALDDVVPDAIAPAPPVEEPVVEEQVVTEDTVTE